MNADYLNREIPTIQDLEEFEECLQEFIDKKRFTAGQFLFEFFYWVKKLSLGESSFCKRDLCEFYLRCIKYKYNIRSQEEYSTYVNIESSYSNLLFNFEAFPKLLDLFPLEVQREIYRSECRNCEVNGKRIEPEELPEELELSNLLNKEPDISSLTVAELKELAKKAKVENYTTMKKAELLEALNK